MSGARVADRVPKVTIGLPVYNGEQFLAQSIETLLGQTFTDFELVISDNASTDRTEEICRKFAEADARILYSRNDRNVGGMNNANLTVDRARGEYYRLAAHDDYAKVWKEQREPWSLETSVPGVFAAGDIRAGAMNRVASAVGE